MYRKYMRRGMMVALAVIAGIFLLSPGLTFAGVGASDTPTVPATVSVGQNGVGGWSFTIENASTTGNSTHSMEITSMFFITACGSSGVPGVCLAGDQEPPNEITINSPATGIGVGGACVGRTFTVTATANPNEYQFTPLTPNTPVILGPSFPAGDPLAMCTVSFTVNIISGPVNDSSGAAGKQTSQHARVLLKDTATEETGGGTGTSTLTVNLCNPTIVTTPNPSSSGHVSTVLNDSATLADGCNPTGTIKFKLFGVADQTCSSAPIFSNTVNVNGNGPYNTSAGFMTTVAGTYHWVATYSGDVSNNSVSSICANEAVVIRPPTIITTPNPTSGLVGTVLNDNATLSDGVNPTGTITFKLFGVNDQTCGSTPIFTNTVPVSGAGPYSTLAGFMTTAAGTYHWVATYSGDNNNDSVSSICADEAVVIGICNPTIVTTPNPSSSGHRQTTLNDSATLADGCNPTGTIKFKLFGVADQTCSGAPIFSNTVNVNGNGPYNTSAGFMTTVAGTYHWIATYSGDPNNNGVSSICANEAVVIKPPKISTTPDPSSGPVGTELFDSATLSDGINPTGTIKFKLFGVADQTCSGAPIFSNTVNVNGNGPYNTSAGFMTTAAGTYHWIATYSGDANNDGVSSICANEAVVIGTPSGGESPYIGIVGNDIEFNPFYFSEKHRQFLFDQEAIDVPVCFGTVPSSSLQTRVPVPPAPAVGCEQFRSNKPINQPEICDTTGTVDDLFNGDFTFLGEPNAVITKQSAGYFEWWIRLPKKPNGEINICIQCGILKPNTFLPFGFGAIELCAAETGERIGKGVCTRNQVAAGVNPIINSALPKITAWAYPGPQAPVDFKPFRLTAYKNPGTYNLSDSPDAVDDAVISGHMRNSPALQVLDGSVNARVLLKSCMDKCVIAKIPVTDQVNALGDTEQDLEAGDLIKVRLDVPYNNTVDIYCHSQSTKLAGVGEGQ